MLQSKLFSKTTKNLPEGETSKNAQFLIKAGFIDKSSAGVYSMLPLGLRVLDKINKIIREEMNVIDGEELLMPALIHKKYWEKANRWDTDIIYRTGERDKTLPAGRQGQETSNLQYGLGWTHEEVITAIATRFINSYRDLPKAVYQIQTKFRAEARAQAGILRGREFLMKDLYSFHTTKEDLDKYYQKVISAYKKIFKRLDLRTLIIEAGGGAFTKEYTHEFQVLNPAGEDTIYYCEKCGFGQNHEIFEKSAHKCSAEIMSGKAIEVGNVFKLGTKFSDAFSLFYLDKKGVKKSVIMGSYGIGPTRVMGAIVEEYNDEKGIIWPDSVSPFKCHLMFLGDSKKVKNEADKIYKVLAGQIGESEVLYDERNASIGEKLNDADLLGITYRIVVSDKTVAAKKIELKKRSEERIKLVTMKQLLDLLE